jgi:hypothetical protein
LESRTEKCWTRQMSAAKIQEKNFNLQETLLQPQWHRQEQCYPPVLSLLASGQLWQLHLYLEPEKGPQSTLIKLIVYKLAPKCPCPDRLPLQRPSYACAWPSTQDVWYHNEHPHWLHQSVAMDGC